jgi:hypothetical protein
MSEAIKKLRRGQDLAWGDLKPAFAWAVLTAMESEYEAALASNRAQIHITPSYPPIVQLLIDSVPDEPLKRGDDRG